MQIDLSKMPVAVLLFGAEGCPACEAFLPRFREAAQRHPAVKAFAVDCYSPKAAGAADHFKIEATPTTILWWDGDEEKRFVGEGSRADLEKLFGYAEGLLSRTRDDAEDELEGGMFFRRR